ncbi:hypothetical protein LSCM1_02552 [Leishmania martiniquensis]|uniref:EF-hand domain-containing protein n=1 Tax=Leishmania martiniquensis TaxID=1580590 RepID=A0A836GKG2_9TRYP|nr:hypothetical protein LSCM1_02552 [Leishmania martiniquensis]
MSVSPRGPGSTRSSEGPRSRTGGSSLKKRQNRFNAAEADVTEPPESIAYLFGKQRSANRRAKCQKQFEELAQLIGVMSAGVPPENTADAGGADVVSLPPASNLPTEKLFPTLEVGYLARVLGLNVSKEQVASIVELVEDDIPSAGFVNRQKLGLVLVDAMMTGTLGGPTLLPFSTESRASTAPISDDDPVFLSAERLKSFAPSVCVREEKATLLRAFEAIDTEKKGYLEEVQLRSAMKDGEEGLSPEEVDDMWLAMCDPETNRAYYRDFVEILASE